MAASRKSLDLDGMFSQSMPFQIRVTFWRGKVTVFHDAERGRVVRNRDDLVSEPCGQPGLPARFRGLAVALSVAGMHHRGDTGPAGGQGAVELGIGVVRVDQCGR